MMQTSQRPTILGMFSVLNNLFLFKQADRKSGLQSTHTHTHKSFTKNAEVTNHYTPVTHSSFCEAGFVTT